jgi:4-amino-4-deoxy-L-arabinose transferase-like glycosyltransferase
MKPRQYASWLLIAVALLLVFYVRVRLLDMPLERDEGEHAYSAQLMLQGIPPWKLSYNMKPPGTDAYYAVFMSIFGQTTAAIHLGLLAANCATILLIALLGARLFGQTAGCAAGAAYAILSLNQNIAPLAAHSTHFVVLFAIAGFLLLWQTDHPPSPVQSFVAGLLFGCAFLMKQPGLLFGIFGAIYLAWRCVRRLPIFALGGSLPVILVGLSLWKAGVFPQFWFWTVTLAEDYASLLSLSERIGSFISTAPRVFLPGAPLWVLAVAGLAVTVWNRQTRKPALVLAALCATSCLAVAGGGAFREQYYVLVLPAAALAAGAGLSFFDDRLKHAVLAAFALACLYPVAAQYRFLFTMNPLEASRSTYGLNPFPEAIEVARYISTHSRQNDEIAVLGSEAEIYFYARRRSATAFLFTYALTSPSRYVDALQGQMISQIEAASPEYIVWANVDTSWLLRPDTLNATLFWARDYIKNRYELAGLADILPDATIYTWGEAAKKIQPQSPTYLMVFRRSSH